MPYTIFPEKQQAVTYQQLASACKDEINYLKSDTLSVNVPCCAFWRKHSSRGRYKEALSSEQITGLTDQLQLLINFASQHRHGVYYLSLRFNEETLQTHFLNLLYHVDTLTLKSVVTIDERNSPIDDNVMLLKQRLAQYKSVFYSPQLNKAIEDAIHFFDELEDRQEDHHSFNAYFRHG